MRFVLIPLVIMVLVIFAAMLLAMPPDTIAVSPV
jgi:hypothetical protein